MLRNRSPTRANDGVTPYKRWYGMVPDLTHLRIFGCPVSAVVPKERRLKWDSKSNLLILVGYEPYAGGYVLWDPVKGREVRARDVIFHEDALQPIAIPKVEEVKSEEATPAPSSSQADSLLPRRMTAESLLRRRTPLYQTPRLNPNPSAKLRLASLISSPIFLLAHLVPDSRVPALLALLSRPHSLLESFLNLKLPIRCRLGNH